MNTFPEGTTNLILRIPLALEPHEDLLTWSGKSSGEFSVRIAYKLLQDRDSIAYALQNNYKDFYRKLWRLDLPSKIKILIWKISWNYLPTRVNLSFRNLSSNIACPRCNGSNETTNDIFRECPASQTEWKDLSDLTFFLFPNADLIDWLTGVFASLSVEKCRLYCGVLWAIWGDRNSRIHEKRGRSSQEIINFVRGYLKELDGVRKVDRTLPKEEMAWNPPSGQTVKINFDGAFDERGKQAASGVVVRNKTGRVLVSVIGLHKGVTSAFETEAIAC
ncbi:reverse transcriptase [Gossypium australe]|uniref:Reverse transcriptase n=1 Tax=Gossypium australe TaxID=47621 RepID=A0A5B6VPP1_9ROSI|nr:reverse transcriptase [Gossypium australe]